jgi:nitrate reductase alpha subunit
MAPEINRRDFMKIGGAAGVAVVGGLILSRVGFLQAQSGIDNPLSFYPNRDWESVYRDQNRVDRKFSWVCAPNDTHNCRLNASVRNGVITRIEQPYDISEYDDIYGNHATANWNPRGCLKGLAYSRRVYSPSRIKGPVVRKGWKEWADAGFPRGSDGVVDRGGAWRRNRGDLEAGGGFYILVHDSGVHGTVRKRSR